MTKKTLGAIALSLLAWAPLPAAAGEAEQALERNLDTVWESLWHQSGTPTPVARWEGPIRVAVLGSPSAEHRAASLAALAEAAAVAGVKLSESSAKAANFTIEVVADSAMDNDQPCVTTLNFGVNSRVEGGWMQMRARDVARCVHHEALHAMGLRGHPSGDSALSYLSPTLHAFSSMDRAMLRAWYAPAMRAGMTPLEALPVMARELAASAADPRTASAVVDAYMARTLDRMEAFASGSYDGPPVLRKSGKTTPLGVSYGREMMAYYLGLAYQTGSAGPADPAKAQRWFERAAAAKDPQAQAQARARLDGLLGKRPPS